MPSRASLSSRTAGAALRAARRAANVTQAELGKRMGVSTQRVQAVECGVRGASEAWFARANAALTASSGESPDGSSSH